MTFAPATYREAMDREEASLSLRGSREKRLYPQVPLLAFNQKLAAVLPKLIEFVASPELRRHPIWGTAIPYDIPSYGTGQSLGHCIRPDVLLTSSGPKICELDFVPSGRGYLLEALDDEDQWDVCHTFVDWYKKMGVDKVLYATASTTVCFEETAVFAERLRRCDDFKIRAVNIDAAQESDLSGALIDRLSYRSEMSLPEDQRSLSGRLVATAEPYLDSKAIFAMIHDKSLSQVLKNALGSDGLAFLREVIPHTVLVDSIKDDVERWKIAEAHDKWVIKATEVETDFSWGCRGTIPGANYNKPKFLKVLQGDYPKNKYSGKKPILQEWFPSKDFWQVWDATVQGQYKRSELKSSGQSVAEKTLQMHTREVGARIGFYFLVVRKTGECLVTPYGDLVLRQDRLIHGATDAICLATKAY